MPTAYVTGATGMVGLNLVERLAREGWDVRALHRASSDLTFLSRFDAERAIGDITDRESLRASMPEGVDVVFSVAASVNFWAPNNDTQTKINVDGTRNLVDTALEKKAKRFVHVSSIAAHAPRDGDVIREDSESHAESHWVNYFRTKWLADEQVRSGVERGLDAVTVAPGNILGPYDLGNWSRLFNLLKAGDLPGVFPGSAPWCHVKNVVEALMRARETGAPGERYNIGSVSASYLDAAKKIADLVGVKPPRPMPVWALKAIGRVMDWGSRITRKEPDITPEVAHLCSMNFSFDCTKAEQELGYREVTLDEMLADTHDWLVAEGRL
jgi:nucleoside-diphosphate-sugar epimerase